MTASIAVHLFDFTRARIIGMTRLHHALFTLSTLYFGEAGGTWHGTSKLGSYAYGNGCGDRGQYNLDEDKRTPLRWLRRITGPAKALALATAVGFVALRIVDLQRAGLAGRSPFAEEPEVRLGGEAADQPSWATWPTASSTVPPEADQCLDRLRAAICVRAPSWGPVL